MTKPADHAPVPATTTPVPLPRITRGPVDEWDYDDRHETRATSDDQTLRRYVTFGWHRVAQRLVPVVFLAVFYIGSIVMLVDALPEVPLRTIVWCVSVGVGLIAGGGYGASIQRSRRRRR